MRGFRYTLPMRKAKPKLSGRPTAARPTPGSYRPGDVLSCALMHCPAVVAVTDATGIIEYVNAKFTEVTGYTEAEALGQGASLLKSGQMPAEHYAVLWQELAQGRDWTGEFHNRRKDGTFYWEKATISAVRDDTGAVRHYLKLAEDITRGKQLEADLRASFEALKAREEELQATCRQLAATTRALRRSERKLERISQQDELTGLLNRRGWQIELRRLEELARRQRFAVGILVIDIDHFKRINDRFGHAAGDRVLRECAALLRARLRASDLLCRYGGDELVVALPSATAKTTVRTAERILATVRRHPFGPINPELSVTFSIGAASANPARGDSFDETIRQADQALYAVKRNGRNGVALWQHDLEPVAG